MKKLLCCLIMAAVLIAGSAQAESMLRLHVIGKTNLPEDQHFKLLVRDAAIEYISENGTNDIAGLEEYLNSFAGYMHIGDMIRVEKGTFHYAESRSAGNHYPAGCYEALRIYIGSAEGRNWWGMLYTEFSGIGDENVIYYSAIVDWFFRLFGMADHTCGG